MHCWSFYSQNCPIYSVHRTRPQFDYGDRDINSRRRCLETALLFRSVRPLLTKDLNFRFFTGKKQQLKESVLFTEWSTWRILNNCFWPSGVCDAWQITAKLQARARSKRKKRKRNNARWHGGGGKGDIAPEQGSKRTRRHRTMSNAFLETECGELVRCTLSIQYMYNYRWILTGG